MRKGLAGVLAVLLGATAASTASAQPFPIRGSDTLEDVVKGAPATPSVGVIPACVAAGILGTTGGVPNITYLGGGSGGGQTALQAGQQRIAPMSRPLNGTACLIGNCSVTTTTTCNVDANCPAGETCVLHPPQGTVDPRGEQLLIALDGVAVVAANQTHGDSLFDDGTGTTAGCGDKLVGINLPVTMFTGNTCGGAIACNASEGCDPVNGYTFADWKEVLALLYGGQKNVKFCSVTTTQVCKAATDCPAGEACNLPGQLGNVTGHCSVTTTTSCVANAGCPTGETCVITDGKHRNPARIDCAAGPRRALAANWGALFDTACGAPTTNPASGATPFCRRLKHAFRRGDLSGTTDTFATLTGMVAVPGFSTTFLPNPLGAETVTPSSATANPFCNAGTAAMNKGMSDYLDLDPVRRIADATGAATTPIGRLGLEQISQGWNAPANPNAVNTTDCRADLIDIPAAQDIDLGAPSRQNVGPDAAQTATFRANQEPLVKQRRGLGLVLPVEVPTNLTVANGFFGFDPATPGSLATCTAGKFGATTPGLANSICPDQLSVGVCLLPVQCLNAACTQVNFNCMEPSAAGAHSPLSDARSYNLNVVDTLGHYLVDGYRNGQITLAANRQVRAVTGAFFRLHSTQITTLGGPSPGGVAAGAIVNATVSPAGLPQQFSFASASCMQLTSTDQISCLVKASPCSIGYAGREAVDKLPNPLNTLAYQLGVAAADAKPPTDTNINNLLNTTAVFYPMARKLFVNHWNDPALPAPASASNEENLYTCFKDSTITNPVVSAYHFLPVPGFAGGVPKVDNVCPNNR